MRRAKAQGSRCCAMRWLSSTGRGRKPPEVLGYVIGGDYGAGRVRPRREQMARVSTYLNFARSTEQAFLFYKGVFGTDFALPVARFRDIPPQPGQPPLSQADSNL